MSADYQAFLAAKAPADPPSGFGEAPGLPACLKPFQAAITAWALRRGRAALFEGTGLGKTIQQLAWANAIVDHEQAPVLILTPLAVAEQTVAEAAKFGIPGVAYAPDRHSESPITVTNYERFDKFRIEDFAGIVLDESGILKSQDGKTRAELTDACRDTPWRLCCTATPAPNDYTELGQHAEFLGVMSAKEMLSMYFVHDGSIRADDHSQTNDGWRLKRHAAKDFWRWLASWSVMLRHPADLGFDEPGYDLPPLNLHQITVAAEYKPTAGQLFPVAASTLGERIRVRGSTVEERVLATARIVGETLFGNVLSATCYQTPQKNAAAPKPGSDTRTILNGKRPLNEPQSKAGNPKRGAPTNGLITKPIKTNSTTELLSSESGTTPSGASDTPATRPTERLSNGERELFRAVPLQKSVGEDLSRNTELPLRSTMPCLPSKMAAAPFAIEGSETERGGGCTSITATIPASFAGFSAQPAILASANSETTETYWPAPSNISLPPPARWLIWCKLNKEQDRLESMLKDNCFSVYGSLSAEEKVARINGWLAGERPVLLTKPKICGWGLNFQSCHKMVFVGATDSFEETYQAIRRCWRFGQARPVDVYFVASELEGAVVANLRRKEEAFDAMLNAMASHMRDLIRENVVGGRIASDAYNPTVPMEIPAWL